MIAGLIPLLVMVTVAGLIARSVATRNNPARPDGDLRDQIARFFRLGLLLTGVVLVTEGVAGLVTELVPREDLFYRGDSIALARSMAFVVVGAPLLGGLAVWQRRRLRNDPSEEATQGWAAYLTIIMGTALLIGTMALNSTANWLFGAADRDPASLGRVVPWAAVLALHWRLAARVARRSAEAPMHLLFGSAVGLVIAGIGVARLVTEALQRIYEQRWPTVVLQTDSDRFVHAAVMTAIGAGVWLWYWLRHTAAFGRSTSRDAYVLLGGVLGGLITAVVGAAQGLYHVLEWFLGDAGGGQAAQQFASLPSALGTTAAGGMIWAYHRTVVRHEAHDVSGARQEIDRIYSYLGGAVGLVTATVGVTLVGTALFESASVGSGLLDDGQATDTSVLALTLLAVGTPVWGAYWRRSQRFAADVAELRSVARRAYLFLLFGVAAVVALVSLIVLLTQVFQDIAEGTLAGATLDRVRVTLSLVLATGTVSLYHALVFRTDRRRLAAAGPAPQEALARQLREVVLVSPSDGIIEQAAQLQRRTGVRVIPWRMGTPVGAVPAAPSPAGTDQTALDTVIRDAAAANPWATRLLLLCRAEGTVEVLPVV